MYYYVYIKITIKSSFIYLLLDFKIKKVTFNKN